MYKVSVIQMPYGNNRMIIETIDFYN